MTLEINIFLRTNMSMLAYKHSLGHIQFFSSPTNIKLSILGDAAIVKNK